MTDDRDRVMRIIAHRCPEIDVSDLLATEPDLPSEIGDLLLQALDEIAVRLDRIEQDVTREDDDDDESQRSYRRRA